MFRVSELCERADPPASEERAIAEAGCIVASTVGSTVHGLGLEGQDDLDVMGVCVEPKEYVLGLRRFEQYVYRTQPEGARSGPGDLDLTVYSLRKYARLAAGGNPTILLLLFAPPGALLYSTPLGEALRALGPAFVSKRAIKAFLKYSDNQREALVGERGGYRANRPELIERYGYDVKYAYHLLRLGYEGCEIAETGRLSLPMPEGPRGVCQAVRRGEYTREQALELSRGLSARLEGYLESSSVPPEPDWAAIDAFLVAAHEEHWSRA
jgi:predicted nucleotidyltransferase